MPMTTMGPARVFAMGWDLIPVNDNDRTTSPDSALDRIASTPILFRIAVRHLALDAWEVIGRRELDEQLTQPVVQFMQDRGDFRRCTIFDT